MATRKNAKSKKSTAAAKKAAATPLTDEQVEEGKFYIFGGYDEEDEEQLLEKGDRVKCVIEYEQDGDEDQSYGVVAEDDVDAYEEDPDDEDVNVETVYASELLADDSDYSSEEEEEEDDEEKEDTDEEEEVDEEEGEDEDDDEIALEDMTVKELKEYAEDNEIDLGKARGKAKILAAIQAAESEEEEDDEEEEEQQEEEKPAPKKKAATKKEAAKKDDAPANVWTERGRAYDKKDPTEKQEAAFYKKAEEVGVDPDEFSTWLQAGRKIDAALKSAAKTKAREDAKAAIKAAAAKEKAKKDTEKEVPLVLTKEVEAAMEGHSAVNAAKILAKQSAISDHTLGGVLCKIERDGDYLKIKKDGAFLYADEDGNDPTNKGFHDFIEDELRIRYRKARTLMANYVLATAAKIPHSKMGAIPYSKFNYIKAIVEKAVEAKEKDAIKEALEAAANLPTAQLEEWADVKRKEMNIVVPGRGSKGNFKVMKFKVAKDQEKAAKKILETAKGDMDEGASDDDAFMHIIKEWSQWHDEQ